MVYTEPLGGCDVPSFYYAEPPGQIFWKTASLLVDIYNSSVEFCMINVAIMSVLYNVQ